MWAFSFVVALGAAAAVAGDAAGMVAEVDAGGGVAAVPEGEGRGQNIFADIFSQKADWSAISDVAKGVLNSIGGATAANSDDDESTASLDAVLSAARDMAAASLASRPERSIPQLIEHFKVHFKESQAMLQEAFAHVDFDKLSLAALWYYVEHTESIRTPSWKRRKHRFHERVETETLLELHDALHLMQIAYLPSQERIEREVATNFRNGTYETVYAVTTGHPTKPAHFIMMPTKEQQQKRGGGGSVLEIVIAIRGSGDLGDFVSDSMMNATSYRSGKAHDGIKRSGKFMANLHIDKLRELLEVSGRKRAKVTLVGYSLGAGVAAIAAIELNDYDFIDAQAIAFGCPALLDLEQSLSTKDYITTIVSDSDIIARMSGPSIANMFLDVLSFDWTDMALLDLGLLLDHVGKTFPVDKGLVKKWANDTLTKNYRPHFATIPKERMETELFPPGNCVHLWRNGAGWTGTYTPCSFFDSVEFSRTLVDDHLLEPGYHPALLSLAREALSDQNFQFEHDLVGLGESTT